MAGCWHRFGDSNRIVELGFRLIGSANEIIRFGRGLGAGAGAGGEGAEEDRLAVAVLNIKAGPTPKDYALQLCSGGNVGDQFIVADVVFLRLDAKP